MLRPLLNIVPIDQPQQAARLYVPFTLLNRALTPARFLLISWLLTGDLGKAAFGQYQLSLEVINWLVALALFGSAEVAERYISAAEHAGQIPQFLSRHFFRLFYTAGGLFLLLCLSAPFLTKLIPFAPIIFVLIGANVIILACYQWFNGVLRGLRAYGAAAGMEFSAGILFLLFAIVGAAYGQTIGLLLAYAASNLFPLLYYALALRRHLHTSPSSTTPSPTPNNHSSFAFWSFLRLLLMMSFGLLTLWSVRLLASQSLHANLITSASFPHGPTTLPARADALTADFANPSRISQMLAFIGLAFWSSSYGIAARHYSHGRRRRALVELLKIGKRGGLLLFLLATILTITRDYWLFVLPSTYHAAIQELLPSLLGLALWYALLVFFQTFADLTERPWIGTLLWGTVILFQLICLSIPLILGLAPTFAIFDTHGITGFEMFNPARWVLLSSAFGMGVATLLVTPYFFWRPRKMTATAVPLGLILFAGLAFQTPSWVVGALTSVLACLIIGFLWTAGLLKR